MKKILFTTVTLVILMVGQFSTVQAQTTVNLAQQCDCEVKKPGTEVTAGATTPAGTNVGDLLVDASGDIFYWDGDSWEVTMAGNASILTPGTEVTAGATAPAGTNVGDLLVDASGDIFYWDGDSWEVASVEQGADVFRATGGNSYVPATNGANALIFPNVLSSGSGTYNTSTGTYTIAESGYYLLTASTELRVQSPTGTQQLLFMTLYLNGAQYISSRSPMPNFQQYSSGNYYSHGNLTNVLYLNAGDVVAPYFDITGSYTSPEYRPSFGHFSVTKITNGSSGGSGSGSSGVDMTSVWNNANGSHANENSTDINYMSGNVGIGTTSPSSRLTVEDNLLQSLVIARYPGNPINKTVGFLARDNGAGAWFGYMGTEAVANEGAAIVAGSGKGISLFTDVTDAGDPNSAPLANLAMRITQPGYMGIGVASPAEKLHVNGRIQAGESTTNGLNGLLRLKGTNPNATNPDVEWSLWAMNQYGGRTNRTFEIWNNNLTNGGGDAVFIIDELSNVGIRTTNPTARLSVNGTANKTGGGAWATFSDIRVKKNVQSYTDGLSQILQIQPKTFEYNGKGGYENDGKTYYGIIAQDMEQVAPYMVSTVKTKDFDDQRVYDGTALTYMLVNAVKEQQRQIEALQKENVALKEQTAAINSLQKQFNSLKAMLESKTTEAAVSQESDKE